MYSQAKKKWFQKKIFAVKNASHAKAVTGQWVSKMTDNGKSKCVVLASPNQPYPLPQLPSEALPATQLAEILNCLSFLVRNYFYISHFK